MCNILVKLCFVNLLLLLEIVYARRNGCPVQVSDVSTNSEKVLWQSTGVDYEIVISNPPCINNEHNLLTRICSNGSWLPQERPTCRDLLQKPSPCPNDMIEISDKCISIMKGKVWEQRCQHFGYKKKLTSETELVWLPAKRQVPYGPYESVTRGEDFGHPISSSYNILYNYSDIFMKDCLVVNSKGDLFPANCSEKHTFICSVNDDRIEGPENCISAGITTQKWFCKRKSCENLAHINSSEEKNRLLKLVEDEYCFIGGNTTYREHLGLRQALGKSKWFYTQKNLSCSLCIESQRQISSNIEMVLEFNVKKVKLILGIYSSDNIYGDGEEEYIYCFTDASKELKKKVKVEKVHKSKKITYYKVKLEKYIGHYWCEAHSKETGELVSTSKILAYRLKTGNEYSLGLSVSDVCNVFNCSLEGGALDYSELDDEIILKPLRESVDEIRVMEVFYFDFKRLMILLHLTTKKPRPILDEFIELNNTIRNLHDKIEVIFFRNSEYCIQETTTDSMFWPETKIGDVAVPANPCVTEEGLPISRVCSGYFVNGSHWSDPDGNCSRNMTDTTRFMYSVYQKNITNRYIADIEKLTETEELTVLGHYYLTKVLRKISDYAFTDNKTLDVLNNTFKITSNLMKMNAEILSEAEKYLNVTDEIIDALEDLTAIWNDFEDFLLVNENVILHIANPFVTNTTGILLYKDENGFSVENFKRHYTYNMLENKDNLQFACHAPEQLLIGIPENMTGSVRVISTVFLKPHFFPERTRSPSGPVVSIIIQGLEGYLPNPIAVWFRSSSEREPTCAFWDYGKKTSRHKGTWSETGGKYMGKIDNSSSLHVCTFSHLTHFALLASNTQISPNSTDESILDAITITGDILSLIGIGGIIATALMFRNWRRKPGTKILLNLSVAISIEILAMFLIQMRVLHTNFHCRFVGPMLHYILLCKYFWMLVYAFLQYNRFVKVLAAIPNNIVLKSVIFGWGFSSIPVVIVSVTNPDTYTINDYKFCYPTDLSLYLGIYLPITLIIILNGIVFCIVMRNISSTMADPYLQKIDSRTQKLQLKLATLLFFVLGLPILFGLLSNLVRVKWLQIIMVYIFSISSNIQGFILFLFYVILNKETRQQWINHFTKTKDKSPSRTTSTK